MVFPTPSVRSNISSVNVQAAPHKALLIGGPVNGRLTQLSKEQIEGGYEFYEGLSGSAFYRKLTTLGDTTIMVHDEVTAPKTAKVYKDLEDLKVRNRELSDKLIGANKDLEDLEDEFGRHKKLTKMARDLMDLA